MRERYCKACKAFHPVNEWPHAKPVSEFRAELPEYDEYLHGPKAGRFLKCGACGHLHDVENWPENHVWEDPPQRSELAAPFIISDNLEVIGGLNGVQCQASGKFYTSKARLRAEYRARGMIEIGNEKPAPLKKPAPDRRKIKAAVERAISVVDNEGATVANYRARSKKKTAFGTIAPAN